MANPKSAYSQNKPPIPHMSSGAGNKKAGATQTHPKDEKNVKKRKKYYSIFFFAKKSTTI